MESNNTKVQKCEQCELNFDVPKLWNEQTLEELLINLEMCAMCAFYLAGDDQMDLVNMVEDNLDMEIDEFDPINMYYKSFSELKDIVREYNHYITREKIKEKRLKVVVDKWKTSLLSCSDNYQIFTIEYDE